MPPTRDDVLAAMQEHAFFGGLDADAQSRIADVSHVQSASEGTLLFQTGDSFRGFYLLVSGSVQIYRLNASGRMLVLHVIQPGESFAEVPLFDAEAPDTYPATAEALADSTLLFVPKDAFLSFVDAHPRACLGMLGEMAQRLRNAVRQLDALSLHDVKERLAQHLWSEAQSDSPPSDAPPSDAPASPSGSQSGSPSGSTVKLDVPKSVLAAELGTVPETLSRALRDLEDDGLILRRGEHIDLPDPAALARLGSVD